MLSYAAVFTLRRPRVSWTLATALLITTYGALLRLDAFVGKYGTLQHPAWARFATHDVAPVARHLRPSAVEWRPEARPYVGGDPFNYLKFAREMTAFYQPHVREPMFLTATRAGLAALDQQDAGVSLASAVGSTLAILGTYLVGAALVSPLGGLVAAAILAVEYDAITWAVDGWRDDFFTATILFAAWALLRFHDRPVFRYAVLAGITGGIASLTRITALSFLVPALAWVAIAGPGSTRRDRAIYAGVASVILAACVLPFLISCAIATGDPFFSINYHTVYYRSAEGVRAAEPMSAADYIRSKFSHLPIGTIDVGITGVFVRPFVTKWNGLSVWMPELGRVLSWLAAAGLAMMPFSAKGRLTLLILLTSLVPYAFTWNIGDGGAWRFTMHAYPFYIAAAVFAMAGVYRVLDAGMTGKAFPWRRSARRAALVLAAMGAAAAAWSLTIPWLVVREMIQKRESVSIETGGRDWAFFRDGWSPPHVEGLVPVRVSRVDRASVFMPLPDKAPYVLMLRLDPVAPAVQNVLTVLFNSQVVGRFHLDWNPQRVGAYRVPLPAAWAKTGTNELTLIPDAMVAAGSAGPRFAWMDPSERIGLRVWYIRVLPDTP
jgi:4-amino-4-deoxy-L-arabinose transferase-like glycosyltransferase